MTFLSQDLGNISRQRVFSSGINMLDNYLLNNAHQDIKRKHSACFIIYDKNSQLIKGYYTLSSNSIPLDTVPEFIREKLPGSYKSIPITFLRRLAVDYRYQKQGIGKLLLLDALKRSYKASREIDSVAVIVDPIDQAAEHFYIRFGFIKIPDSGKMFLPMKTIVQLFE